MDQDLVARLHARASKLNEDWELDDPGEDTTVPFDDVRIATIEHVCHELAHAALLRIPFGPHLSTRTADKIRTLKDGGCLNEMRTFAVVMGVLRQFKLPVCEGTMADACEVQLCRYTGDETIDGVWAEFPQTKTYEKTVARVARTMTTKEIRWPKTKN